MRATYPGRLAEGLQSRGSPRPTILRLDDRVLAAGMNGNEMTQPALFKRSLSILPFILTLQTLAPPIVADGMLYAFARIYQVEFNGAFIALAVVVAVLSLAFFRPPANPILQLPAGRLSLGIDVIVRWAILFSVLLVVGWLTKTTAGFSRRVIISWALVTPGLLMFVMLAAREFARRVLLEPEYSRSVVFAGYNESSACLAARLTRHSELCMSVAGFFDDRNRERLGMPREQRLLGSFADLARYVKQHGIEVIFIALPARHVNRTQDVLDELGDTTASIYYVPDIFAFDLIQARTTDILGIPVVAMCETPFYGYRGLGKRVGDIIMASGVLLMLAPLMAAIACFIRASSPGPVFFTQRRYGLDGREIVVYKFRTMTVWEDGAIVRQATADDLRTTRIGRVLRRYSLDELPQLINVLQGRMSLVGPRPHAVAHNEQYRRLIKGYMIRHKVLPGLTGLAQVNGCRGETVRLEDMQRRVQYDLEYLRNWSSLLDLKILLMTLPRVISGYKAF